MKQPKAKPQRNYDLRQLLRPYENQWVALSSDQRKVLGAGKTLKEAKEKAAKTRKAPVFVKLPPYDAYHVPTGM